MATDDCDGHPDAPLDRIAIEDRLRRVKLAAGRPRRRRRLDRLTGEPGRTDRVLVAAAGSVCATAVLTYLWWRAERRGRPRHAATAGTGLPDLLRRTPGRR